MSIGFYWLGIRLCVYFGGKKGVYGSILLQYVTKFTIRSIIFVQTSALGLTIKPPQRVNGISRMDMHLIYLENSRKYP